LCFGGVEDRDMSLQSSFLNRAIECERLARSAENHQARRAFRELARAWRGESIQLWTGPDGNRGVPTRTARWGVASSQPSIV
jgi:hypothetical protein